MAINEERLPDPVNAPAESEQSKKKAKKKEGNFFSRTAKRIARWFREMRSELKKVVWTSRSQLINNCIVVLVVVVISAVVLWAFDQLAMMTVNAIISLGR
ncbi:MAG TPA: preprotein translocase subunit SecE [Clostridiales bacterium]|jgi:preprotein translocase subunit SecE|nr:preprotein translocase subunit SecE [Clostridiales bacterium]